MRKIEFLLYELPIVPTKPKSHKGNGNNNFRPAGHNNTNRHEVYFADIGYRGLLNYKGSCSVCDNCFECPIPDYLCKGGDK